MAPVDAVSACAVFSRVRSWQEKRTVSVCEQASEVHMVLPSRSGASRGCDCIHSVPCLHRLAGVFTVLFSTACARRHGIMNSLRALRDRGWSDSQTEARNRTLSTLTLAISIPASLFAATGTTRPGSPLEGIWHWGQDVRIPRMPSGLVTCQLPEQAKLTPGRYRRVDEANCTRVHEVQVN